MMTFMMYCWVLLIPLVTYLKKKQCVMCSGERKWEVGTTYIGERKWEVGKHLYMKEKVGSRYHLCTERKWEVDTI